MIYRSPGFPPAWVRSEESTRSSVAIDRAQNYSSAENVGDFYSIRPSVYADRNGRWTSVAGNVSGDVVAVFDVRLPMPSWASGARVVRYAVFTASLLHVNSSGSWADFSYRAWAIVGGYPEGTEIEPCALTVRVSPQRVDTDLLVSDNSVLEPRSDGLVWVLGKGAGLAWADKTSRGKHLDWVDGSTGQSPPRGIAVPGGSFHVGLRIGKAGHPLMETRVLGVEILYEVE